MVIHFGTLKVLDLTARNYICSGSVESLCPCRGTRRQFHPCLLRVKDPRSIHGQGVTNALEVAFIKNMVVEKVCCMQLRSINSLDCLQ